MPRPRRLPLLPSSTPEETSPNDPRFSPVERPRTRGDCLPGGINEQRPCPFVGCRHHLALDVHPASGNITLRLDPEQLELAPATCALDVADRGGLVLDEVAQVLGGVTRERIRQIEEKALGKLASKGGPKLRELDQ